jgi:transcriptional regulator with XRE-family HTH domain
MTELIKEWTPGLCIRAFLMNKKMTQLEFSKLIGVNLVTISRWINHRSVISLKHRRLIEKKTDGLLKAEDLCPSNVLHSPD